MLSALPEQEIPDETLEALFEQDTLTKMATPQGTVSPPEPFSFSKPQLWCRWIRRFERYSKASGLADKGDEAHLNMLIYCMGDEADDILTSFKYADGESEKSYETVRKKFDAHFVPQRNVIYERALFNSRRQEPGEPVDSFITALHTLVEHCNYEGLRDQMIRDRIVVGINNSSLSEKLQLDSKLTLATAITQVRQSEAVKLQQPTLRGNPKDTPVGEVQSKHHARPKQAPQKSKPKNSRPENSKCSWCGKSPSHSRQKCPAKDATCRKCKKTGHYEAVCRSAAKVSSIEQEEDAFIGTVSDRSKDNWSITLQVNDKPTEFHIDTGAEVTVISERVWTHLDKPALQPSDRNLKCPDTHSLPVMGMFTASIKSHTHETKTQVYVVKGASRSLLGQPAIEQLHLIQRIGVVSSQSLNPHAEFPGLFTGLGKLDGDYTIQLKEGAKPFALSTPRRVAIPLLEPVKEELQRMERLGVISKIQEPTDWCSGMVVVPKGDGKVRICVDLTKLNESVQRERHPLPAVDQVLAQLSGAKVMSKLDANAGFWQIPLSEESSRLTTFITPFGRYRFHRLPFGISSAPEHFQRRMSEMLAGIPNVVCMMDDVLVYGETLEEHNKHLREVLTRLEKAGMTLNNEKCKFAQTSLQFLGHVIDSSGVRPDPGKIEAITEFKQPKNVGDVRRYLGMVNHLSKFAPNLAEVTQPMRELLNKDTHWVWEEAQQTAFEKTKEMLTKSPILTLFDPNLETTVSADASSFGLGAVLLQKQSDGENKPVAYISRSMTSTEQRYAQIEKEALAFTWACERLSDYLIGLKFHIWTDHKPLVPLFSTKHLEEMPIRVQRFRLRMMRYDFSISHVPGKQLLIADALSRSTSRDPTDDDESFHQEGNAYIQLIMQNLPATEQRMEQIKELQQQDEACQLVTKYCYSSWPDKKTAPRVVRPFLPLAAQFSVENGVLMRGSRIVIPPPLQQQILEKLHEGHLGITKCRDRARQSVWWPGLSTQLEKIVTSCETCCKHQQQRAQPLVPSELPELPWQKIGTDLFEWKGDPFLLYVDYYSRYIEIAKLNRTTAGEVINKSKSIFARHGIPEIVFSDNGPQYTAEAFEDFAKSYQFVHKTSSPCFPQSNGEAERAVRTVKNMLEKSSDPYLALLNYRTTPIQGGQYSPAELLMSRLPRTKVPTTRERRKPEIPDETRVRNRDQHMKNKQKKNHDKHHGARELPHVEEGDRVWIPTRNEEATVIETDVAPRSHVIRTNQGSEIRRNRKDIIQLPEERTQQLSTQNDQSPQLHENNQSPQSHENDQSTGPRRSTRTQRPTEHFAPFIKH